MLTLLIFSFLTSFCAYFCYSLLIIHLGKRIHSKFIGNLNNITHTVSSVSKNNPSNNHILTVYLSIYSSTTLTFHTSLPKVLILVVSLTLNSDVYSFIYLIRLFSSTTSSSRIHAINIYAFHSSIAF